MKKVCILIGLLIVFLCGCTPAPQKNEEAWTVDFEQKDKEFGQFQKANGDGIDAYAEEIDEITRKAEEYVELIMAQDAKPLVDSFSEKLIAYLGEVNGVSYATAREIAEERVLENFEKTAIRDLYNEWKDGKCEFEIVKVRIFSQRAELKEAYLSCGIKIIDAINVDFKVKTDMDERKARLRLVQNADGSWVADADYFF